MADTNAPRAVWKPSGYVKDALMGLLDKANATATINDIQVQPLPEGSAAPVSSEVPVEQSLFKPSHHSLTLQNWVSGETYDIAIKLKNIDKVQRNLIRPLAKKADRGMTTRSHGRSR